MTIQGIIDFCRENYEEISLADHIRIFYNSDIDRSRLCTVVNKFHDFMLQSVLDENEQIIEIYIDFRENPENIVNVAFMFSEEGEHEKIPYMEIRNIDFDMEWV